MFFPFFFPPFSLQNRKFKFSNKIKQKKERRERDGRLSTLTTTTSLPCVSFFLSLLLPARLSRSFFFLSIFLPPPVSRSRPKKIAKKKRREEVTKEKKREAPLDTRRRRRRRLSTSTATPLPSLPPSPLPPLLPQFFSLRLRARHHGPPHTKKEQKKTRRVGFEPTLLSEIDYQSFDLEVLKRGYNPSPQKPKKSTILVNRLDRSAIGALAVNYCY